MDGVAVMVALLSGHEPLTSLVGDRIFAGTVPQGVALPAVGVSEISRPPQDTVARNGATTLINARIQVTVHAKNYPEQKRVILAAKLGPGVHTGTIAGVAVKSVLHDMVGPDLSDDAAGIFQQSRDFKVAYLEPN